MAHVTSVHYAISNPFIYTIIFYFYKICGISMGGGDISCSVCALRCTPSHIYTIIFYFYKSRLIEFLSF